MAGKSGDTGGKYNNMAGKHDDDDDDIFAGKSPSVAGNYDDLSRKYESWKEKYNKIMAGEFDVLAGDSSHGASLSGASTGMDVLPKVRTCMYVYVCLCM